MQTEVSVIVPVYNAREFLAEALQSVLEQTHQSFELIAIDDGSTDGSWDILEDFARRDKRVFVSRRENRGVAATANECLERAKNELVVRLDADDVMLPNRLERQIWFMQQHQDISVATSYAWLIDRNGNVLARAKPTVDVDRGIRECNPHHFAETIQAATIMRKRHILAVGGYSPRYRFAEDRELWGRLVASGYQLSVQPEFLLKVRLHGSSLTAETMRENQLICKYINQNIVRLLRGQTYISYEIFMENRRRTPLLRRLTRAAEEASLLFYKRGTRDFAERKWWRFLKHGTAAICLNPIWGVRMFQKLTLKRSV
jgi:glycosyltransferase involved in cell wall biosynthesis